MAQERVETAVQEFLAAMREAGNPGTVEVRRGKPRMFRTPKLTGWVVIPVDREDFEKPRRYEPGLFLTVDGAFHRLDSDLRGYGTRDFPRYELHVPEEPIEPPDDERALEALDRLASEVSRG